MIQLVVELIVLRRGHSHAFFVEVIQLFATWSRSWGNRE